jgi:hypothetical protein
MSQDAATLRVIASACKSAAVEALGARDWLLTGELDGAAKRAQAADRSLARAELLQAQLAAGKPDHARPVRLGRQCVQKAREAVAACRDAADPAAAERAAKGAVRAAEAILVEMPREETRAQRTYARAWSTDRSSAGSR